jgi:ubiquinone/menaquinone biosynthesis C-methylase UbiE
MVAKSKNPELRTRVKGRSQVQKAKDFISFPIRAVFILGRDRDKWGLSALSSERFDYVAREVIGFCLDVGCGRNNRFIAEYLNGQGKGIDVFPYEGLSQENLVEDITHIPFPDASFESVTFIANINHISPPKRDTELAEAYRCLKPGGNVIVTMGNPVAEILVHKLIQLYGRILGTFESADLQRGMHPEEQYYLTDPEIIERLSRAGFGNITRKRFLTQWGLNHLFVGWKTR